MQLTQFGNDPQRFFDAHNSRQFSISMKARKYGILGLARLDIYVTNSCLSYRLDCNRPNCVNCVRISIQLHSFAYMVYISILFGIPSSRKSELPLKKKRVPAPMRWLPAPCLSGLASCLLPVCVAIPCVHLLPLVSSAFRLVSSLQPRQILAVCSVPAVFL